MKKLVYDGKLFCHTNNCCPVAEYDDQHKTVSISDPSKPENGTFTMTAGEWNTLLQNARPVTL